MEDRTKPSSANRFEEQESLSFGVRHRQSEGLLSGNTGSCSLMSDFRCELPRGDPWQVPVGRIHTELERYFL